MNGVWRRRVVASAVALLLVWAIGQPAWGQAEVSPGQALESVGEVVTVCGWVDSFTPVLEGDSLHLSVRTTGTGRTAGRFVGDPFVVAVPATLRPSFRLDSEPDLYVCATGEVLSAGPPHMVAEADSVERALSSEEDVEPPERLNYVAPRPDGGALRRVGGGIVTLRAIIDRSGGLRDVRVLQSLDRALDRNAVDAVVQWRYSPPLVDGTPVRLKLLVMVQFQRQ